MFTRFHKTSHIVVYRQDGSEFTLCGAPPNHPKAHPEALVCRSCVREQVEDFSLLGRNLAEETAKRENTMRELRDARGQVSVAFQTIIGMEEALLTYSGVVQEMCNAGLDAHEKWGK